MFLLVLLLLGGVTSCSSHSPQYGFITSPNFPKMYPTEKRITWSIAVPDGYHISLKFLVFNLELSDGCSRDFVTISEPNKAQEGIIIGLPSQVQVDTRELVRFCGPMTSSSHPGHQVFVSKGNQMTIEFYTTFYNEKNSSANLYSGFQAYYQAVDNDECAFQVHKGSPPCQQFCHNYIGGYFCSCLPGYTLQSDNGSCKAVDSGISSLTVDCGNPQEINYGEVTFGLTTYQSEAKYNCNTEYYNLSGEETYSCSFDGLWVNSKGQSDPPECKPVCGKTTLELHSRIYGGSEAKNGYFPWVVHFASESIGGGSLISDQWVLTAAHMVQDYQQPRIHAGDVTHRIAIELEAKKVILHPDWIIQDNAVRKNYDNDIALVQLSRKVEMGPCISPVCLPENMEDSSPAINEVGYVAGWGKTKDDFNRLKTRKLQYAAVSVRKTEECEKSVNTDQVFTENMMCAGGDGKDSCQGDAGGPLMFRYVSDEVKDENLYIGGIVSWGFKCGDFGMYTKVKNYLPWIKETIQKTEQEDGDQKTETLRICRENSY